MAVPMRTRIAIGLAVVITATAAVVAAFVMIPRATTDDFEADPQPTLPIPTRPAPNATPPSQPDPCRDEADGPFVPESISLEGDDAHPVMQLPRDARGVPGVPPFTQDGKWTYGWDGAPSPLPGSPRGHVLVNAHTYPDGSALGNLLLDELQDGMVLVVRGEGRVQCYRAGRQFEVHAESRDSGYENDDGPPRLAILVCSGTRTGPGDWSHRTIWFAEAIDASPSTSP